jgi:hypothetical protein
MEIYKYTISMTERQHAGAESIMSVQLPSILSQAEARNGHAGVPKSQFRKKLHVRSNSKHHINLTAVRSLAGDSRARAL